MENLLQVRIFGDYISRWSKNFEIYWFTVLVFSLCYVTSTHFKIQILWLQ